MLKKARESARAHLKLIRTDSQLTDTHTQAHTKPTDQQNVSPVNGNRARKHIYVYVFAKSRIKV